MGAGPPVWMKPFAHGRVLIGLFVEKIFANIILILALLAVAAFLQGGLLYWQSVLAVIAGYTAAFMVNFYLQFSRYRDGNPNLKSNHARSFSELTATLREDYRDMNRRDPH